MTRENLREKGNLMEEMAAAYLTERGVRILERNFRSREAEADIIGKQDGTVLFIEVKARAEDQKSGAAAEAVGTAKQKRICRCADYYLHSKGIDPYRTNIRFDVIAITMRGEQEKSKIRWIRNAFDYVPFSKRKPHWRIW